MLNAVTPTFKYYFCLHANETLTRLEQTPKLVIAALNGHTVGGGLEIALACDIRIARKGAGKIGLPEMNLGVLPGTGGTQRMARALPKNKAIELMAEARLMDFEEALELGLINYIYESDGYWDKVMAYATRLLPAEQGVARGWSPEAVRAVRRRRSRSPRRWRSSASCSSSASRARTRKKASRPTTRSASRYSRRGRSRERAYVMWGQRANWRAGPCFIM